MLLDPYPSIYQRFNRIYIIQFQKLCKYCNHAVHNKANFEKKNGQ